MPHPITVYLDDPNQRFSKQLVKFLVKKNYQFDIVDRSTPESIKQLKYHGHMYARAPIVQVNKAFFYEHTLYDPVTGKIGDIPKRWLKAMALRTTPTEIEMVTEGVEA